MADEKRVEYSAIAQIQTACEKLIKKKTGFFLAMIYIIQSYAKRVEESSNAAMVKLEKGPNNSHFNELLDIARNPASLKKFEFHTHSEEYKVMEDLWRGFNTADIWRDKFAVRIRAIQNNMIGADLASRHHLLWKNWSEIAGLMMKNKLATQFGFKSIGDDTTTTKSERKQRVKKEKTSPKKKKPKRKSLLDSDEDEEPAPARRGRKRKTHAKEEEKEEAPAMIRSPSIVQNAQLAVAAARIQAGEQSNSESLAAICRDSCIQLAHELEALKAELEDETEEEDVIGPAWDNMRQKVRKNDGRFFLAQLEKIRQQIFSSCKLKDELIANAFCDVVDAVFYQDDHKVDHAATVFITELLQDCMNTANRLTRDLRPFFKHWKSVFQSCTMVEGEYMSGSSEALLRGVNDLLDLDVKDAVVHWSTEWRERTATIKEKSWMKTVAWKIVMEEQILE